MIREAKIQDISTLVVLLEEYYEEGNAARLPFEADKLSNNLYSAIIDDEKNVTVLEKKGETIGITISCLVNPLFSSQKVVECQVLFVKKQHRQGNNGVVLIKALSRWAKQEKSPYVYLGIASEINTDRTVALYKALGYKPIGQDFRLEV